LDDRQADWMVSTMVVEWAAMKAPSKVVSMVELWAARMAEEMVVHWAEWMALQSDKMWAG